MSGRKTTPAAGRAFFNPFPKYLQVRQALERRMNADYELGQQIPTEEALRAEFGVSRETVREALRGLEQDGIVQRHRARGTFFVRRPDPPATEKLTGLVEDFTALHLNTRAEVLEAGVTRTPPPAALAPVSADELFFIKRLRHFDGQPLVLHEAWLPQDIGQQLARLDLRHAALSELMEHALGIRSREESQQIEATVADTELARLLGIAIGAPVLLVTRLLRLPQHGGAVLFHSHFRADRYRYTLKLAPVAARKKPGRKSPSTG
jgi:GntR family transcriptional regulator